MTGFEPRAQVNLRKIRPFCANSARLIPRFTPDGGLWRSIASSTRGPRRAPNLPIS